MKLIGTALLKKTAVIAGLLMPVCGFANGIDVSWTGPKQLTIRPQPDGLSDFTTICKTGKTIYFYALISTSGGLKQRMIASGPGVASGSCAEALAKVLPVSITLGADESYFYGLGREINSRPPDGNVNVSLSFTSGTGNGWKPQPPPGPACSLVGNSVDISYGDIQATSVPGLKKSSNLYVKCSASATVKVTLIGYTSSGIKLRTDGSLTADVLVRDQPANVGTLEKIAANQTMAVPISSLLKVNGNLAGGAFRGSAVINVDIL
ncbi:MrpH family fimbial adhesin [Serratia fonticola]